jgi:SAM-dependent methyltransferase
VPQPNGLPVPSPALQAFLGKGFNRPLIYDFIAPRAHGLPNGAAVLDAGSGTAPYRELFAHCSYSTTDWENSIYDESRQADYIGSLESLPVPDGAFDVVVLTEVLEHVEEPVAALTELRRVLRSGGRLWMTTPMVWQLHEEPYDFYRYTSHGLRSLLGRSGFAEIDVQPLSGYFLTLGQVMRNCAPSIGVNRREGALKLRGIAAVLHVLGELVRRLDRLDRRRALPIGYACEATRAEPGRGEA